MKKILALLLIALLTASAAFCAFAEDDEIRPVELPKVVSAGIIEDGIRKAHPDEQEANEIIFVTETLVPFSTTVDMVSEMMDPDSEMNGYHPLHKGAKVVASTLTELLPPGVSAITNNIAQKVIDGVSDTCEFIGNEIEEKGFGGFVNEMADAVVTMTEHPEIVTAIIKAGAKNLKDFFLHLLW